MSTDTITHLCLAGPRDCRARVAVDNGRGGKRYEATGTEKPNTLCHKCTHHTKRAINELPADYKRLNDNIGDIDHNRTGEKVHGTNDLPMPFNGIRDALMRRIAEYLRIAARRITGDNHEDKRDHQAVTLCAALVANQLDKLLQSPGIPEELWAPGGDRRELTHKTGIDIALKLADLHREANAELEGYKPTNRVQLPYGCGACGEPNLYREGHTVRCPNEACRKDWTDPAHQAINKRLADHKRHEEEEMEKLEQAKWLHAEAQHHARQQALWLLAEAQHRPPDPRIPAITEIATQLANLATNPQTAAVNAATVAELLTLALKTT